MAVERERRVCARACMCARVCVRVRRECAPANACTVRLQHKHTSNEVSHSSVVVYVRWVGQFGGGFGVLQNYNNLIQYQTWICIVYHTNRVPHEQLPLMLGKHSRIPWWMHCFCTQFWNVQYISISQTHRFSGAVMEGWCGKRNKKFLFAAHAKLEALCQILHQLKHHNCAHYINNYSPNCLSVEQ